MKAIQRIDTDVLVIGGGGAGLMAAIEAAKNNVNVLLVSISRIGYGNNTAISGARLTATGWGKPEDNPEQHLQDTIVGGCYLNNRKLVAAMVRSAKQQINNLMEYGVKFVEQAGGGLRIHQGPGHINPRTVVCQSGFGTGLTMPLLKYAQKVGIQFKEGILIIQLLKTDGVVNGAIGLDKDGQAFAFNAKATILATGGLGQLFFRTTNATSITGMGYSLAYEVGLPLLDMEFTQFYPTSLADYGGSAFIIYEGIAPGEPLLIKNSLGEDVLERHGVKNIYLKTRDVFTRVIMEELLEGRGINDALVLDLSALPESARERLPILPPKPRKSFTQLRISPSAHYQMGGVIIDENGKTAVNGLYASGEVCGGIHGASRLAGNALTEIFVFGAAAGDSAAKYALNNKLAPIKESKLSDEKKRLESPLRDKGEDITALRKRLKRLMWDKAGIVRDANSLKETLKEIDQLRDRLAEAAIANGKQLGEATELRGMLTVSEMMARAGLMRTESRGAHYRTDYPEENNQEWLKNIVIHRDKENMVLKTVPVEGGGKM